MNSNPCFKGIPKLDAAPPDRKVDIPIFISSFALEEAIKNKDKIINKFFFNLYNFFSIYLEICYK